MISDKKLLYDHVDFLTKIRPFRNYKHLESLNKVVKYIVDAFMTYGLTIELQHWKVQGNTYTNVIGSYNINKGKRLIVGAHYDVCGEQEGADDNASAVAGLLETARLVALEKRALPYQIDFVAYCLEEPPFFATEQMGSYIHAKSLKEKKVDVIGMLCYEMIGYFSDKPHSQNFPLPQLAALYPNKGNFIIVVGLDKHADFTNKVYQLMAEKSAIDVQFINFPSAEGLAGLSDHRNYWHFGYKAVMINDTSFLRNHHYHQPSDTIQTLDFEKMKAVVDDCVFAVLHLE